MVEINGNKCHATLMKKNTPKLSYSSEQDFDAWEKVIKDKLRELIGIDLIEENVCESDMVIEEDVMKKGYSQMLRIQQRNRRARSCRPCS